MSRGSRSLIIVLVIELAAIGSPVSAFTLGRHGIEPATDLTAAETSNLHVRNELRRNDVKTIDVNNDAISQKIVPIETTAKTEDIQKNVFKVESDVAASSAAYEHQGIDDKTTKGTSEGTSEVITSISNGYVSDTTSEHVLESENPSTTVTSQQITTENATVQGTLNVSVTSESAVGMTDRELDNTTNYSTETIERNETTSTVLTSSLAQIISSNTTNRDVEENNVTTTSTSETKATSELKRQKESTTIRSEYSSITPYWKKYTAIERKRTGNTSVEDETASSTEKEEVMVRAHTAQASISLEKAFSISSDIPSLERLKIELLSLTSKQPTTKALEATSPLFADDTAPLSTPGSTELADIGTMSSETTSSNGGTRFGILTSQRAGFLDYSSKAIPSELTTVENKAQRIKQDEMEKPRTVEPLNDQRSNKKINSMASQSQLAEDAINEELMKEEMLNANIDTTPLREEQFGARNIKHSVVTEKPVTTSTQYVVQAIQDTSIEDKLSVRPISSERSKNAGLYTISPNYKPLKKLEVQPPKPFVRNPDDNSWRNESLSSLGIVFKAKNSSKPFTEVLKNKTETEMNALPGKYNKDEEPELRERLEKIAEIRKSKKKKIDGETVYGDYEEGNVSGETTSLPKIEIPIPTRVYPTDVLKISPPNLSVNELVANSETTTIKDVKAPIQLEETVITTKPPIKQYNIESYDGVDDEEADYVTLANIDLKKYITSVRDSQGPFTTPATAVVQPIRQYLPDRQPTLQYFPPRITQKVNVNQYDDDFQRTNNAYTVNNKVPKKLAIIPYPTLPALAAERDRHNTIRPTDYTPRQRPVDQNRNNYNFNEDNSYANEDGFNKATYVIKHLRDFINEAGKDSDEERNPQYIITEVPARGVTRNEYVQQNREKSNDYEDYESQFRKEVLDRFVDNFNQNSERFKADFPILYNTSVVHSKLSGGDRGQASSSAFMKRLYEDARTRGGYVQKCDPNCERLVELSPEYELHYYVPDQEEREQVEARPLTRGGPLPTIPGAQPYRIRV